MKEKRIKKYRKIKEKTRRKRKKRKKNSLVTEKRGNEKRMKNM